MIHLFNVPFPKWNPCNPTKPGNLTVYISCTPTAQWNLIRAKTVYSCLDSDIYWKWPLVKVIANAWKGSAMKPWRLSVPRATQTEPGMLIGSYIKRDTLRQRSFLTRGSKENAENLKLRVKTWYSAETVYFQSKRTKICDWLSMCPIRNRAMLCSVGTNDQQLSLTSTHIVLFSYCSVSPSIQQCVQIHHMIQWKCLCRRAEIRQLPLIKFLLRPSVSSLFGMRLSWTSYLEEPPRSVARPQLPVLFPTTGINYNRSRVSSALTVCGTCGNHRAPVNTATALRSRSEYDMAARVPPSRPWKDPKATRWQVSRGGADVTTGSCHCLSVTGF